MARKNSKNAESIQPWVLLTVSRSGVRTWRDYKDQNEAREQAKKLAPTMKAALVIYRKWS